MSNAASAVSVHTWGKEILGGSRLAEQPEAFVERAETAGLPDLEQTEKLPCLVNH